MTEPSPQHSPTPTPSRTIRRIVVETVFVLFLGALAFGMGAEFEFHTVGLILAITIWVIGTPALEIARMMQQRH